MRPVSFGSVDIRFHWDTPPVFHSFSTSDYHCFDHTAVPGSVVFRVFQSTSGRSVLLGTLIRFSGHYQPYSTSSSWGTSRTTNLQHIPSRRQPVACSGVVPALFPPALSDHSPWTPHRHIANVKAKAIVRNDDVGEKVLFPPHLLFERPPLIRGPTRPHTRAFYQQANKLA